MSEEKPGISRANLELSIAAGLGLLVLAVYFRVVAFEFINFDDNLYIYENGIILGGLNGTTLRFAFEAFYSANWHPLTWLSHALDVQLFGTNAGAHHAVNVAIHLLNSILAFSVFRRYTGRIWESAAIAALFAIHPAHVESVAWVSERKDVLSTMFWLLTMWAYVRYVEAELPGPVFRKYASPKYLAVVALFACGLMSKPMLVTLPFVLVLADFWPLERWTNRRELGPLVAEKLPLFALSAMSSLITYLAQRSGGAVESLGVIPLGFRVMNATVAYVKYIGMAIYPKDLAVLYPMPTDISAAEFAGSLLLLIAITGLCIWQVRTRKYLLFGWLFFLGTLVPVIGIVQVGSQSMADRYTYIPYFGLFTMAVFGVAELASNFSRYRKPILWSAAGLVIGVLAVAAGRQVQYWQNNETLYLHTLAVTQNNFLITHNLCYARTFQDRFDEAVPLCLEAIDINPQDPLAYNTLGIINFKLAKYAEAESYFKQSIDHGSRYGLTFLNVGLAQVLQGRPEDGEVSLKRAADITNDTVPPQFFATAVTALADAYAAKQNYAKSAENYRRLVFIDPSNVGARVLLANALLKAGKFDDAQSEAEAVLGAVPDSAEMLNVYGLVLLAKGRAADAEQAFQKALKISPNLTGVSENLAKARART